MEILILIIALLILVVWIYALDRRKYCPKCGTQLDRTGNDYHCRKCRILYHMNLFGKLKKKMIMDYEKKYKEALEKAKEFYALCEKCGAKDTVDFLEDSFPELKESEDEKVEKAIFGMVYDSDNELWSSYDVSKSDVLAWLEKQGELVNSLSEGLDNAHERIDKLIQKNNELCINLEKQGEEKISDKTETMKHSYITTNPEFFQWIYDRLKYVYNENPNVDYMLSLKERIEDMQKFADKIKPKFKVDDWIIDNKNRVGIIVRILDGHYIISFDGREVQIPFEWEGKLFKKWTIQDAKDGDVLCTYECDEPKIVFILKGTPKKHYALSYHCYYNIMYPHFASDSEKGCLAPNDEDVKPATKEQRDTLFAKMQKAGYEWDAEKKELRLLITNGGDFFESENCDQKPAEWKQENREELTEFENAMMHIGESFFGENAGLDPNDTNTIKEQAELLLELAPKTEWSEEDVYNSKLILSTISQDQDLSLETKDKLTSWLKSLKDRVQPKQEWNKGDMEMLNAAISFVELLSFTTIGKGKNNTVAWLKSLKSRVIPQPKQGWNEKDEKNLQGIIDEIQANKNNAPSYDIPVYEGFLNWLKSLKQNMKG